MEVPAEFSLFMWAWSQVRNPTVPSGAVQRSLHSNTSLANGYSVKAGTSLNSISCLCQGSLRIKKVAVFSHPLKAFLCMGEQGRDLPVCIHKAGQRKAQNLFLWSTDREEKPREISSSCFCSLMASKQDILFLRAQGRLGIFSSEPNPT